MHRAWWTFVVGVLACGAVPRVDGHLEAAGPSLQTAGVRTLGRQAGAPAGGRRLALVVGNDAYRDSPLRNAVNDARAVAAGLADVGFTVRRVENASRARMAGAIGRFAADLTEDDVALFYFAGHGVQVGESPENYLIPTDFDGRTESAVRLNALKAADVVGELQRARVAMAVFDACRNNPYRGTRGPTGLAAMEARGTLIAYAAGAGQLSSDNPAGQNGLFTQHFVAALREPGLTATALFRQVRRGVVAASRERQWPAVYDDLLADFVFRAPVTGGGPDVVLAVADPGEVFRDCATCPEMVMIPAGTFQMGSRRDDDEAAADERPRHRVSVERFALGRYEVTRAEYGAFVSATGHDVSGGCYERVYDADADAWSWSLDGTASWRNPGFSQGGDHPVVCVNWRDAQAFVEWLSRETGKRYRLPSEAEWEYAARAGTVTRHWWGDEAGAQQCEYANGSDATHEQQVLRRFVDGDWPGPADCTDGSVWTAPVGSFSPNDFGLHDVLGNVWEWVEDCWHETYARAPADGSAWTSGGDCGRRVLRGGSWYDFPRLLRSATRGGVIPGSWNHLVGFRVSRTLD